jgi:hypothetical protein
MQTDTLQKAPASLEEIGQLIHQLRPGYGITFFAKPGSTMGWAVEKRATHEEYFWRGGENGSLEEIDDVEELIQIIFNDIAHYPCYIIYQPWTPAMEREEEEPRSYGRGQCEDYPCCGHEPGCCPARDENGRQLDMKCVCGASVPLNSRSSLCRSCLQAPEDY